MMNFRAVALPGLLLDVVPGVVSVEHCAIRQQAKYDLNEPFTYNQM